MLTQMITDVETKEAFAFKLYHVVTWVKTRRIYTEQTLNHFEM